jgi:hypothetical protein
MLLNKGNSVHKLTSLISNIICTTLIFLSSVTMAEKISDHPDFNGIWEITEYDEVVRPEETGRYTEEALRRAKFYKENFDPITESHSMFCDTTGMPWTMLGRARNYPREIYQSKDRIVFAVEYMDQVRQIRLNESEFPDYIAPSSQGYSIGHWEDNVLVVETKGFVATSEATVFHRSDEAQIIEKWKLLTHPKYGEVIEIELKMTDPVFYKEPVIGKTLIQRADPGVMLGQYGCPATIWENFIEKRKEEIKSKDK